MTVCTARPSTYTLVLNEEERAEMGNDLKQALAETRLEEHCTYTPRYREQVIHREDVIKGLIEKLTRLGL